MEIKYKKITLTNRKINELRIVYLIREQIAKIKGKSAPSALPCVNLTEDYEWRFRPRSYVLKSYYILCIVIMWYGFWCERLNFIDTYIKYTWQKFNGWNRIGRLKLVSSHVICSDYFFIIINFSNVLGSLVWANY